MTLNWRLHFWEIRHHPDFYRFSIFIFIQKICYITWKEIGFWSSFWVFLLSTTPIFWPINFRLYRNFGISFQNHFNLILTQKNSAANNIACDTLSSKPTNKSFFILCQGGRTLRGLIICVFIYVYISYVLFVYKQWHCNKKWNKNFVYYFLSASRIHFFKRLYLNFTTISKP